MVGSAVGRVETLVAPLNPFIERDYAWQSMYRRIAATKEPMEQALSTSWHGLTTGVRSRRVRSRQVLEGGRIAMATVSTEDPQFQLAIQACAVALRRMADL